MIGSFFKGLLQRFYCGRKNDSKSPASPVQSEPGGVVPNYVFAENVFGITCNSYGGSSGPKTRAEACRQQCRERGHIREPMHTQYESAPGTVDDDWRYQPCPPCCVPPAPCPPTCSDFHLTTTEYYPVNDNSASCRWDNATCYNEGNDQSGNLIKQWNRHCHFTTYRGGPENRNGSCTRGCQRGSQCQRGGQYQRGGYYAHDGGAYNPSSTYPSGACCRKDGEDGRTYVGTDPAGRSLISGAQRPTEKQCHRKVEKVYTKTMKSEPMQTSSMAGGTSSHGTTGNSNVTALPTKSPKSAITAALVDPSMLNRHGNQLWWNQKNNSQRIIANTANKGNPEKMDAQHRNVEMPILFFRKPKDGADFKIFLGGWNNTKSIIRKDLMKPDVTEAHTPGILSAYEYREFWIRWECGVIKAGVQGDHDPILLYHDPHLFHVSYFGVCTGWGAVGHWLIDHVALAPSPSTHFPIPGPPSMYYPNPGQQPQYNPFYPQQTSPCHGNIPRWTTCSGGTIPPGAVVGGHDVRGEPVYVARAFHSGGTLPGKLVPSHKVTYVAWGGEEIAKSIYEVQRSHGVCYIPFAGAEVAKSTLNNWLLGLHQFWFHIGNVLLHALCTGLFTRVAFAIGGLQMNFVAVAGALFASHPIHTEAVAGMVGRADVLACLFFILSFLTYHDTRWRCKRRVLLSCAFATAGLLAKETGISVLFVNLLYDFYISWTYLKKAFLEMRWNEESTLFCKRMVTLSIVIIILITVRLALLQGTLPKFSNQDNPAAFHPVPSVRFLTYSYLAAFNFWLLLFPFSLSHDWQMGSIPLVTNVLDQRNVFTCLFFILCCWTVYKILVDVEHHRHVPLVLGLLFLVLPFIPASNLFVTVGFVVAERLLYIPSMGLILLVVYGGQILSQKLTLFFQRSWPVTFAFYLLILVWTLRTMQRNEDWSNRESLIKSGLTAVPNNAKMHYNGANYLRESGQRELSIQHYKEALRLWPSYASAHNNLGTLMKSAKDAEAHFLAAIKYAPGHVNAHFNLGQVYKKMNKTDKAVLMLKKCLHLNPNYISAYLLLAKLYNGQIAGRLLKHVTKLEPTDPNYYMYYARWLHEKHRLTEAVHNYKKALHYCPSHKSSLIGLAHVYRDIGYVSRLHQVIIRWHMYCRQSHRDNSRILYTKDLYIRGWDMYKQGQRTLLREHTTMPHNGDDIKCHRVEMAPVLIPVEGNIKSPNVGTSSGAVPATFGVARGNGFSNPA